MNPKPDYYAILGASENASRRDIERLYKRQAHKSHPDRGGAEEEMKALNEAYRVLRNENSRREYDSQRLRPPSVDVPIKTAAAAREVGFHGQALSSLLCLGLGLMLLILVRFNGLWFLWPLSILAIGVIAFGVMIAHSAMTNAQESLNSLHPIWRHRGIHEIAFWLLVAGGGCVIYLILTSF